MGSLSSAEKVEARVHRETILTRLPDFRNRNILVVGDLGLDEYVVGEVKRISPEAPVPVVEVNREEQRLGLSGNVAQNIVSLGGKCTLVSVVGNDSAHNSLRQLLDGARVQSDLLVDPLRPTTRKLRVMAQHHHVVRVDYEKRTYLSPELSDNMMARIRHHLPHVDGVIVQDYAKGLLHQNLLRDIFSEARAANKLVLVDPHRNTPLSFYAGANLMTPNYDESLALSGIESDAFKDPEDLLDIMGNKLIDAVGSEKMVITLGSRGMRLIERHAGGLRRVDLPTYARQVFDVTGAGDTVIAAMALAWLSGFTLEQACVTANFAAGVVVSKIGCVPCGVDELKQFIESHE